MPSIEYHAENLRKAQTLDEAQPHLDALRTNSSAEAIKALVHEGFAHKNEDVYEAALSNITSLQLADDDVTNVMKALVEGGLANKNEIAAERSLKELHVLIKRVYMGERGKHYDRKMKISEKVENPLIKRLSHDNPDMITACAWALGYAHSKKALPHLMKLSGHETKNIRKSVKDAITMIQEANRG